MSQLQLYVSKSGLYISHLWCFFFSHLYLYIFTFHMWHYLSFLCCTCVWVLEVIVITSIHLKPRLPKRWANIQQNVRYLGLVCAQWCVNSLPVSVEVSRESLGWFLDKTLSSLFCLSHFSRYHIYILKHTDLKQLKTYDIWYLFFLSLLSGPFLYVRMLFFLSV